MSSSKRRRFIDVLRRTANLKGATSRAVLEDAALWDARDKAARASASSERLAEKVTATATRQRAQIDAAIERVNTLGSRADTSSAIVGITLDAFERLGIVGLNAGLEGARLGEAHGRALTLLADELKATIAPGIEASRKLIGTAASIAGDSAELGQRLERLNKESQEMGGETALLKASAQDTTLALTELEARLRKATGLDPELARNLSAAGDHAKGLILALTALDTRDIGPDHSAVAESLVPVLAPLRRLLTALTDADEGSPAEDG